MIHLPLDTPVQISGVSDSSYIIEPCGHNGEVFFTEKSTKLRLRCGPRLRVTNRGGQGAWARWRVEPHSSDEVVLKSVGHSNNGKNVYLGIRKGTLVVLDHPEMLQVEPVGEKEHMLPPKYTLTEATLRNFIQEGYIHLPKIVGGNLVEDALKTINESLGQAWNEDAQQPVSIPRRAPSIRALLYQSPLWGVVESILGNAQRPEGGQVALRFPNNRKHDPDDEQWHIDGQKKPNMTPFQLLVGVALSAQPTLDYGGLSVFPGCHGMVHDAVMNLGEFDETDPWQGHRPTFGANVALQLKMQPGDVVLAHQKLPHRVTRNTSPHVRYMVYFRISHEKATKAGSRVDGGLWTYFDGVQELL